MKDSEKTAELWRAAPAERLPRNPAGTVAPTSPAVWPCSGTALTQAQSRRAPFPTRMLRRAAKLPAGGGGGSCGGGSYRFASTPVAAQRRWTASSGRSASFAAAVRLSQDHGVAQGPGGPGSPGGKDVPLPDTSGFLGEGRARGVAGGEAPGKRLGRPAPFSGVSRAGRAGLVRWGPGRSPCLGGGGDKLQPLSGPRGGRWSSQPNT